MLTPLTIQRGCDPSRVAQVKSPQSRGESELVNIVTVVFAGVSMKSRAVSSNDSASCQCFLQLTVYVLRSNTCTTEESQQESWFHVTTDHDGDLLLHSLLL